MEHGQIAAGLILGCAMSSACVGELVTFENTNPAFESIPYYQVGIGYVQRGRSLDVTRGAFDQPGEGEIPVGSFLITWFQGASGDAGDWIFLGPGTNTHVAREDALVDVIDPGTLHPVGFIAPLDFDDGGKIGGATNWADSWVAMHTSVSTAPTDDGIHFVDGSFTLGLRFMMEDGVHYGFAEIERTGFEKGKPMSIGYRPVRWGYETTAGVGVPGVGSFLILGFGMGLGTKRRR